MLNCHKATRLMSEAQDRPLTLGEKLALRLHTMMCSACSNFEKQLPALRRMARGFARHQPPTEDTPDKKRE
ncbi:anti-sigma factor family protein [Zobellella maritima]|uniref:anti-sigma factor family protein n=1 Tax=Zobellella maritima TaxID=2059725 RepID=UPI000E302A9D|nr:zf-HC2 domain-containing protein [Zobellella maritima]